MAGKGFGQVLLLTLVPVSLGLYGVFISNKSKVASLDSVFEKVSARISENYQKAEKIKKEQLSNLSPEKGVDLGLIRSFMDHMKLREKVNGCKFMISLHDMPGEYSIADIISKKDDVAKRIYDEIKITKWGGVASKVVDDACFENEEVKIKRAPSKVWNGSYYWKVDNGSWWWQRN